MLRQSLNRSREEVFHLIKKNKQMRIVYGVADKVEWGTALTARAKNILTLYEKETIDDKSIVSCFLQGKYAVIKAKLPIPVKAAIAGPCGRRITELRFMRFVSYRKSLTCPPVLADGKSRGCDLRGLLRTAKALLAHRKVCLRTASYGVSIYAACSVPQKLYMLTARCGDSETRQILEKTPQARLWGG